MSTIIMRTSDDARLGSFLALFQGFPILGNLPISLVSHEAPTGTRKKSGSAPPSPPEPGIFASPQNHPPSSHCAASHPCRHRQKTRCAEYADNQQSISFIEHKHRHADNIQGEKPLAPPSS
ncbi:MAG: hypothetical protein EGP85_14555 [Bifidobacterium bifidum]|nr:hypothetical protein [Bifidobacterium bifidum]